MFVPSYLTVSGHGVIIHARSIPAHEMTYHSLPALNRDWILNKKKVRRTAANLGLAL